MSDFWKQVLAILAVLQALHFMVATPLGMYDNWLFEQKLEEEFWITRYNGARSEILSNLFVNSALLGFSYRELCEDAEKDEFIILTATDCDLIPRLEQIVVDGIDLYEVPEAERDQLRDDLRTTGQLPI